MLLYSVQLPVLKTKAETIRLLSGWTSILATGLILFTQCARLDNSVDT